MAKEEAEMIEAREDEPLTMVRLSEWRQANENLGRAKATLEEARADLQACEVRIRAMAYAVDGLLARLGRAQ